METAMDRPVDGALTAALASAVVQITRDYTGRGPTKARASIHSDVLVVAMQDTLTKGERSLRDNGKSEMVLEVRRCFQATMKDELVDRVQQLSGRKVVAFMSDNHIEPDMAVEIFVLEPLPVNGATAV